MIEINYHYTKEAAMEIGDHYLGLMRQLDKMKKGRMMKVKSLSEVRKRWLSISAAMFFFVVLSLIEFFRKGEMYMLAFAVFLLLYGAGCISTSMRDKKTLDEFKPVLKGTVTIDKKGLREVRDDGRITEFTWKEFEFCIVTERIMTFFGKNKDTVFIAYNESHLAQFEKFLEEQKMDADYIIKC